MSRTLTVSCGFAVAPEEPHCEATECLFLEVDLRRLRRTRHPRDLTSFLTV